MNILVISDSHRALDAIRRLLDIYAKQVKMAVHLGDNADDLLCCQNEYPMLEMHAVTGNCDCGTDGDTEKLLHIGGRRILLIHGHRHQVKSGFDRIAYYAEEKEADACLFGHTHMPVTFEVGRVFFLNPGSLGKPYPGNRPGYGLLRVSDQGVIKGTVLTLP